MSLARTLELTQAEPQRDPVRNDDNKSHQCARLSLSILRRFACLTSMNWKPKKIEPVPLPPIAVPVADDADCSES